VTIRQDQNGTIVLEGACPVEDAEPLLSLLLSNPTAAIDWTQVGPMHTAVMQVVLAAGVEPVGPCGDAWLARWITESPLDFASAGGK
jgi:hypothetical protein